MAYREVEQLLRQHGRVPENSLSVAPRLQWRLAGTQKQARPPQQVAFIGGVVERSLFVRVGAATGVTTLVVAAFLWSAAPADTGGTGKRAYYVASGTRLPAVPPAPSSGLSEGPLDELLEGETRTALQGDEVSDALATYGIDGSGKLYEVHSPETEVPKLGRPTT